MMHLGCKEVATGWNELIRRPNAVTAVLKRKEKPKAVVRIDDEDTRGREETTAAHCVIHDTLTRLLQ